MKTAETGKAKLAFVKVPEKHGYYLTFDEDETTIYLVIDSPENIRLNESKTRQIIENIDSLLGELSDITEERARELMGDYSGQFSQLLMLKYLAESLGIKEQDFSSTLVIKLK